MRILIVDDDAIMVSAMKELLSMDGHEAEHSSNGHGAVAMLPVFNPDAMIMDWKMPMVDGEELLTALRSDGRWKSLPVLVLTAMRPEDLAAEISRIPGGPGNTRVLFKPVTMDDVKAELHELTRMTV